MTSFQRVQGRCPACRRTTLFLGAGGYVTCSLAECPDPCAAADLLEGQHEPDSDDVESFAAYLAAKRGDGLDYRRVARSLLRAYPEVSV